MAGGDETRASAGALRDTAAGRLRERIEHLKAQSACSRRTCLPGDQAPVRLSQGPLPGPGPRTPRSCTPYLRWRTSGWCVGSCSTKLQDIALHPKTCGMAIIRSRHRIYGSHHRHCRRFPRKITRLRRQPPGDAPAIASLISGQTFPLWRHWRTNRQAGPVSSASFPSRNAAAKLVKHLDTGLLGCHGFPEGESIWSMLRAMFFANRAAPNNSLRAQLPPWRRA